MLFPADVRISLNVAAPNKGVVCKGVSSEISQICWDSKNLVSPSPRLRRHTSLSVKPNTQVEIKEGKEDEKKHSCRFLTVLPGEGKHYSRDGNSTTLVRLTQSAFT